ncbi:MAG: Gfo/Idh/MocA family oxidoreductase [Anaerolineae bacterium]|nr:Gfo/Idh/MocA family oxidoreductase [Anaerolineae bacterium]
MSEKVRWGVIGCSWFALTHVIPVMEQANLTNLVAISSRTLSKAQDAADKFNIPKAYGSYEDLLADPAIDAVYIPLPNGFHAEWSIKAMQAGKHVLCEKPLTINAAEAREVQAVRDQTGLFCLEAFASRFNPTFTKAVEITQSGVLGDLRFMHTVSTYYMDPQDPMNVRLRADIGGGALYDMGCYAINAQRMLAGREPLRAWATMQWSERFNVDMAGTAMLDFGDGLLGTIQWGFNAPHGGPFSVQGTKGKLTGPYGWGAPSGAPAMLLTTNGQTEEIYVERANVNISVVQDLSESIRGLHAPVYAWEPLDANMRVIDACYKSQKSGKAETV